MKNIAKYFRHRETGFTLIELLITMAVLSILAATIIPNLSGFIKSGKVTAANAELGYVLTGAQAYYADHVNATADFTSTSLFDNGLISSKPTYAIYNFFYNAIINGNPVYTSTDIKWDAANLEWVKP